ncbi:hypothetical protein AMECASPLE_033706 [Ameca splendens]|uniref:Uncharacterized protein n=1 Tax=Ameca splendens TaxID=208324 RepID=A0ABV1A2B1_9TELE
MLWPFPQDSIPHHHQSHLPPSTPPYCVSVSGIFKSNGSVQPSPTEVPEIFIFYRVEFDSIPSPTTGVYTSAIHSGT